MLLALFFAVILATGKITYHLTTLKSQFLFLGASLLWVAYNFKRIGKIFSFAASDRYILVPLLLFFAALCISLLWESNTYDTAYYVFNNIIYFFYLLAFIQIIDTQARLRLILNGIVILCGFLVICGILEYFQLLSFSGSADQNRIQGTFGNPNYLGAALALLFPPVLSQAFSIYLRIKPQKGMATGPPLLPNDRDKSIVLLFFFGAVSIGLVLVVALTLSRSAIACMLIECFVFICLTVIFIGARSRQLKRKAFFYTGGVVLVATAFFMIALNVSPALKKRFTYDKRGDLSKNPSIARRMVAWDAAIRIWQSNPPLSYMFGRGYGSYYTQIFLHHDPDYRLNSPHIGFKHSHCEYLEILSESGGFALALWLAFIGLSIRGTFKAVNRLDAPYLKLVGISLVASLIGFVCQMSFSVAIRMSVVGIVFYTVIGLTVVLGRMVSISSMPQEAEQSPAVVLRPLFTNRHTEWILFGSICIGLVIINGFGYRYFMSERYHLKAVSSLNNQSAANARAHILSGLNKALNYNKNNIYALYDLANFYLFKKPQETIETCNRIDKVIPQYKNTLRMKGISQILAKDFQGAVSSFETYIRQDAIQGRNYLDLYIALIKTDKPERALEVLIQFFRKQNQYHMHKKEDSFDLRETSIRFSNEAERNSVKIDQKKGVQQATISRPFLKGLTRLLHQNKQLSYNELYTNLNIFVAQTFDQIQYGDICIHYYLAALKSGPLKKQTYQVIYARLTYFVERIKKEIQSNPRMSPRQKNTLQQKVAAYQNQMRTVKAKR